MSINNDLSERGISLQGMVSVKTLEDFIIHELDSDQVIFQQLFGHLSRHLEEFRRADAEPKQLGLLAHKIKAGCHSFGALKLETALEQIEALAEANEVLAMNKLFLLAKELIDPTLTAITGVFRETCERKLNGG